MSKQQAIVFFSSLKYSIKGNKDAQEQWWKLMFKLKRKKKGQKVEGGKKKKKQPTNFPLTDTDPHTCENILLQYSNSK